MNKLINSSQPINLFFQRIDDCVQYASDGQFAFTNGQILHTAYHGVSTSGHYTDAFKDWRKRPLREKNVGALKNILCRRVSRLEGATESK